MFPNYADDPVPSTEIRRTGRPPVTSQAAIVAAARGLIDRDGWERLTMRALAAELGIGTTTLYHHVRDKEDLLLLLLNDHAGQIPRATRARTPRTRIIAAATALHDTLAAWPWAAEVLAVDGFMGRLDESALAVVEDIVAAAVEAGCTPAQAVGVFRNIWYFTVGEILVRARSARDRAENVIDIPDGGFLAAVDATRLPRLAAIGDQWPALAARDTYAAGLRALVDGLLP
jgi:AcrR family transcriptional regulator